MNFDKIREVWNNVYKGEINDLPWVHTKMPSTILDMFIRYLDTPFKLLDFGCGTGRLAKYLSNNKFVHIDLYDISDIAMNYCRNKLKNDNINFIDDLYQIEDTYQGILCWGVFHHLPVEAWTYYIDFFLSHLSENGILLFSDFTRQDSLYEKQDYLQSEITKYATYAVELSAVKQRFSQVIESGVFDFIENKREIHRTLNYIILQK